MFDATYIPPTYEVEASAEPLFQVTPPMPVAEASAPASSFFDARPSANYGDAVETPGEDAIPADAAAAAAPEAVEIAFPEAAAEGIDFESEVAFEAVDAVMFEPSVDHAPAEAPAAAPAEPPDLPPVVDAPAIEAASDDDIDTTAAAPDTEDRVLLQFAATVPHDLAELRRIAADNQW
jgi:hypothetical protein